MINDGQASVPTIKAGLKATLRVQQRPSSHVGIAGERVGGGHGWNIVGGLIRTAGHEGDSRFDGVLP